jgi:hypothetical protein
MQQRHSLGWAGTRLKKVTVKRRFGLRPLLLFLSFAA